MNYAAEEIQIRSCVDDFGADGFAPVKRFSNNEIYENYYVNRNYDVYKKSDEEYTPVLIKQMKKDGKISKNAKVSTKEISESKKELFDNILRGDK